jgi:DNA-binding MarR family transcriptional regulator
MTHGEISPSAEQLVQEVMRFARGIHRIKITLTREAPDRAAYGLLYPLVESDKRAAELAEIVHSDPSTVSRHIAQLVSHGLVQRVPDQNDGRAALLSLTDDGREMCKSLMSVRSKAFATAVRDWSDEDTEKFTAMLLRLNDDLETHHQEIIEGFRSAYDAVAASTDDEDNNDAPFKENA